MSEDGYIRTVPGMGTFVTIHVVGHGADSQREEAVERAFGWFHTVEACCSRFDPRSEVMRLTGRAGVPVAVTTLLFEAVQFALTVASESGGAFDPTIGHAIESRGFNRDYRTGRTVQTVLEPPVSVSYRDVYLDAERRTITLLQPLVLDLGAVAKGLAIDLAARELQPFENFAVDAGGDLYLRGRNPDGEPWSIGIRHPRQEGGVLNSLRLSNCAICTSGDYERRSRGDAGGHHLLDPRSGISAQGVASVTVVAPAAMLADALATAAFVLGPQEGLRLLDRLHVDGLMISPALEQFTTSGMAQRMTREPGQGTNCGE